MGNIQISQNPRRRKIFEPRPSLSKTTIQSGRPPFPIVFQHQQTPPRTALNSLSLTNNNSFRASSLIPHKSRPSYLAVKDNNRYYQCKQTQPMSYRDHCNQSYSYHRQQYGQQQHQRCCRRTPQTPLTERFPLRESIFEGINSPRVVRRPPKNFFQCNGCGIDEKDYGIKRKQVLRRSKKMSSSRKGLQNSLILSERSAKTGYGIDSQVTSKITNNNRNSSRFKQCEKLHYPAHFQFTDSRLSPHSRNFQPQSVNTSRRLPIYNTQQEFIDPTFSQIKKSQYLSPQLLQNSSISLIERQALTERKNQEKHYRCQEIMKKVRNFNDFLNEVKKRIKNECEENQRHRQRNSLNGNQNTMINDSNKDSLSKDYERQRLHSPTVQNHKNRNKDKSTLKNNNALNSQEQQPHQKRAMGTPQTLQLTLRLQNQKIQLQKYKQLFARQLSKQHSIQSIHVQDYYPPNGNLSNKPSKQKILTIQYLNPTIQDQQTAGKYKVKEVRQKYQEVAEKVEELGVLIGGKSSKFSKKYKEREVGQTHRQYYEQQSSDLTITAIQNIIAGKSRQNQLPTQEVQNILQSTKKSKMPVDPISQSSKPQRKSQYHEYSASQSDQVQQFRNAPNRMNHQTNLNRQKQFQPRLMKKSKQQIEYELQSEPQQPESITTNRDLSNPFTKQIDTISKLFEKVQYIGKRQEQNSSTLIDYLEKIQKRDIQQLQRSQNSETDEDFQ